MLLWQRKKIQKMSRSLDLNNCIELTLLKPFSGDQDYFQLVQTAQENKYLGVCVPPSKVGKLKNTTEKAGIKLITVIGFPFGYNTTSVKLYEMSQAIGDGADELDVIINLSDLTDEKNGQIKDELHSLTEMAHDNNKIIKIIIESSLISEQQLKNICTICSEIKPDFVKTSTGFNGEGASVSGIKLLKNLLSSEIGIKASGGIRSVSFAIDLINSGATRIGTSSLAN
jgi:deoxyribose-phosphate aldolase